MNGQQKKQIGDRIKRLRNEMGLLQSQVAERVGVDRVSISNYETGRSVPPWDTLTGLCDLFQTTMEYLLEGVQNENKTPDTFENEREFLESVFELSDAELKKRFTFKIDGRELSSEEYERMIAAVRADRFYKGSAK